MAIRSRLGFGLAFSLTAGLITPLIVPAFSSWGGAAIAQVQLAPAQLDTFTDVSSGHWAHDYIEGLAKLNVINGFPDGTFQPNEPVTRAEFAAILRQAFLQSQPITAQTPFSDVPANYWATNAIYAARSAGFLAGYPGNRFEPDSPIRRDEALVALTNGLKYTGGSLETLAIYSDADFIPRYARSVIAAATQANLVVNYPVADQIGPYRSSSRAEVAAFVYQALVKEGRALPLVAKAESWQSEPIATIPTGSEKMSLTGQRLATLTTGGTRLQIWNALTGALLKEIAADGTTQFEAIALSKSGARVAVISQASLTRTVELSVWSAETGERLWSQSLGTAKQKLRNGPLLAPFVAPFVQVAFSPDDQQIMTQVSLGTSAEGDTDGQLQLQDALTGEVLQSLDYATDGNAALRRFAFSPDGKFLASASHLAANSSRTRDEDRISLWRLNQNGRFDYFQTIQLVEADFAFVDMAFTDSGLLNFLRQRLQGTRLDTWNVNTGWAYGYIELPDADRTDTLIHLSPDGKYYFISGDVAGNRLGNVQTRAVKKLEGSMGRAAAFGTHGDYLAIADGQNIRIFSKTMP